jgi:hypothetical protein
MGVLGRARPGQAIGIELRDERYDKLVIEVDDPDGVVTQIREAAAVAS